MFISDTLHPCARLEKKLRSLYSLKRDRTVDLSFRPVFLDLVKAMVKLERLPPVIHVAGTNGKGSIIATLRSALESAGYKVHAYTSPHLCAFNERIYLAGKYISDEELEILIDKALSLNNGQDATFFEITTAIAFAAFENTPADILLLETGMGGRLDCTNIIEQPLVTIISAIGYDHVEHLGDTLRKIAYEKAGIMKQGVPCIISAQSEEARREGVMEVFETVGREKKSALFRAGAEWFSDIETGHLHFVFRSPDKNVDTILPAPALKGFHQAANCGAALGALEVIADKFPVSEKALREGLQSIQWPARLQDVTRFFDDIIPPGWEIWLDGGHNESAAAVLSTQVKQWEKEDGKNLHLVLGMMDHKDPDSFLYPLRPLISSLTCVDIAGEPKSFSAASMAQQITPGKWPVFQNADIAQAIKDITARKTPEGGRILIAGSLYLAGHVLKTYGQKPDNGSLEARSHAA